MLRSYYIMFSLNVYHFCTLAPHTHVQVCAKASQLSAVEDQLRQLVKLLKDRLEWLNTNSRLAFGVLSHSNVVVVLDSSATDPAQLLPFIRVAQAAVREQIAHIHGFNIIR